MSSQASEATNMFFRAKMHMGYIVIELSDYKSEVIEAIKRPPWPPKAIKMAVRGNMHIHVRAIEVPDFKYEVKSP